MLLKKKVNKIFADVKRGLGIGEGRRPLDGRGQAKGNQLGKINGECRKDTETKNVELKEEKKKEEKEETKDTEKKE